MAGICDKSESRDEVQLTCLPVDSQDKGKQRCRLGKQLMQKFEFTLGQCVKIKMDMTACICRVWPRHDLADGFIQCDNMVTVISDGRNISSTCMAVPASRDVTVTLTPLTTGDAKDVNITIVIKSVEVVKKYRDMSQHHRRQFINNINCLLSYSEFCEKTVFYCEHSNLSTALGVVCVIINECKSCNKEMPGSCENVAFTIKDHTSITIRDVVSRSRFDQLHGRYSGVSDYIKLASISEQFSCINDIMKNRWRSVGFYSQHILLTGPPGCGKTSMVEQLCRQHSAYVVEMSSCDVHHSDVGDSEGSVSHIIDHARDMAVEGPTLLLLDDLHHLCPLYDDGKPHMNRLTSHICAEIDRLNSESPSVLVIGATNSIQSVDKRLKMPGRLAKQIIIPLPSREERFQLLNHFLESWPLSDKNLINNLALSTPAFAPADIKKLCMDTLMLKQASSWGELSFGVEDFLVTLARYPPVLHNNSIGWVDYRKISWSDIGGVDAAKLELQQAVEWPLLYPHMFARLGLAMPSGVLLYGPPGCAKTTLVRAAASACTTTFLSVTGAELYSPYVGDSERTVREVFSKARLLAPCILFLDELDSILGSRDAGSGGGGVQRKVLSTLLNEMDGVGVREPHWTEASVQTEKRLVMEGHSEYDNMVGDSSQESHVYKSNRGVVVVAATNKPHLLDSALLRPGRLDKLVYVPPPGERDRVEILTICSRDMPLSDDVDLCGIAASTGGYTGADLENVCREAGLLALTENGLDAERVEQKHFMMTVSNMRPSITDSDIEYYSNWAAHMH